MLIVFVFVFAAVASNRTAKARSNFLNGYKQIQLGMSMDQVSEILGKNYTESILKNGVTKWEWRFREAGYSTRTYNRVARTSTGTSVSGFTRRATVKFKDGEVIEKNGINLN